MWSMKIAAVLMEDGAFALFFRPRCVFAIQGQNENANAWVLAQGGGRDGVVCIVPLGMTDAFCSLSTWSNDHCKHLLGNMWSLMGKKIQVGDT